MTAPSAPPNPFPPNTIGSIAVIEFNEVQCALLDEKNWMMLTLFDENPAEYNVYKHPVGISRFGGMRVLLSLASMQTLTGTTISPTTPPSSSSLPLVTGPLNIAIFDYPKGTLSSGIQLQNITMADWYPVDPDGNWWAVNLTDARRLMEYNTSKQQLNMPVFSATTPTYITSTANGSSTKGWTLQDVINKLFADLKYPGTVTAPTLPSTPDYSADVPEGINLEYEPTALSIDRLLFRYGLCCILDPTQDSPTFTIDYIGNVTGLSAWEGGASMERWQTLNAGNNPLPPAPFPAKVQVIYPQIPIPAEGLSGAYASSQSGGPTTTGGMIPITATSFAWGTGATPNMPNAPASMAKGFFGRNVNYCRDIFHGIYMPPLIGGIETTTWRVHPTRVTTKIEYWRRESQSGVPSWMNAASWETASYHGCISRVDPFGRQQIFVKEGTFPVLLTYGSSPGADGSATTAATWAYTFYDVSDPGLTTALGTNQQPAPPRALGSMTRQPSSVANTSYSYGLACNGVSGAVILLTAYEVPNKGTC